jgi:hypothetical protein
MLDASDLALALADNPSIDAALRAYEHTMLARSGEIAVMLQGRAADLLGAMLPDFDDEH